MPRVIPRIFHILLLLSVLLVDLHGADAPARKIKDLKPSTLLISFDGFRWDYLDKARTPNLHRLMKEGVRAEALIPSFPTKTFPNHYTIVTGLYPEHHGIIANNIWDPHLQRKFTTDNRVEVGSSDWWGGEPIWVTAEKAGMKTGVLFWPGSEAAIEGVRPTYWLRHDSKMSHEKRLNTFFEWLDKPQAHRPQFFTLYFQDVDDAGHHYGPGSPEQIAAVEKVDATLGKLLEGLKTRGILDRINIVVVSDHGMVRVDPQDDIYLEDYVDLASVRIADWSPVLMIDGGNDNAALIEKLRRMPHVQVYRKEDVPERLHFRDSNRIPPVIAIAEPGWMITTREKLKKREYPAWGEHGYDNADRDTWGIFIARGPAFKRGLRIPPFANIHIYNALCSSLGLQPAPNDGSPDVLAPALRVPALRPQKTAPQTTPPQIAPAADHRSQTAGR
jgi:predicted AlkP superfamily pyrophosphatase or phosphodiesterase